MNQQQLFLEPVSRVVVYWSSLSGERTGQKVFLGSVQIVDRAKAYETKLLNLGFYTHLETHKEVSHG